MPPHVLAATVTILLALAPASARAGHVWRAERLPLADEHFASGAPAATMSVSVDTDENLMHVDFQTGDTGPARHVVRIVGPPRRGDDDGVRVVGVAGRRGHLDWNFPEADQPAILGGRMVLDVESADAARPLTGRIERLVDSPAASTTILTLMALGFAVLSVVVVATQRKGDPLA
jgi:hypothetical protein